MARTWWPEAPIDVTLQHPIVDLLLVECTDVIGQLFVPSHQIRAVVGIDLLGGSPSTHESGNRTKKGICVQRVRDLEVHGSRCHAGKDAPIALDT